MTTTHHEPDLGAEGAAIQEWKRQIAAYRHQRGEVEGEQWGRLAPWYDEWVAHNDYVTLVLPRLCAYLGPKARVLEIGPRDSCLDDRAQQHRCGRQLAIHNRRC